MADDQHLIQTQVHTPEGEVFSGEVEMVSTRTAIGSIGVKARHVPILARLVPTKLRLHMDNGDVEEWAQGEGWLQVFANQAILLTQEALAPDDLDSSDLQSRLDDAEERLEDAEEGSAAYEIAERDKRRAEAFLEIAGGD